MTFEKIDLIRKQFMLEMNLERLIVPQHFKHITGYKRDHRTINALQNDTIDITGTFMINVILIIITIRSIP
jgi:hypothetical protein